MRAYTEHFLVKHTFFENTVASISEPWLFKVELKNFSNLSVQFFWKNDFEIAFYPKSSSSRYVAWRFVSQICVLHLISCLLSRWSASYLISCVVVKSIFTLSFFTWVTFSLWFFNFWPANNPLQYHVCISDTRCLTCFIPIFFFRKKIFSNVIHWRDRPVAQLDTNWHVICFPIKLWCRRRVLIPHSLLTAFRAKSTYTLNIRL